MIDYVMLKLKVNATRMSNTQAVINEIIGMHHHTLRWPLRKLNVSLQKSHVIGYRVYPTEKTGYVGY